MNFLRTALIAGTAAASIATIPAAQAQRYWTPRGWHVIGTTTVNGRATPTPSTPPGARISARCRRRLQCADHLRDVTIRFNNGAKQDARVREYLRANSCTRAIDLRGRTRDLSGIRMKYDRIYRGRTPVVQVAGVKLHAAG